MLSISLQSCEVKAFAEEANQFVKEVNVLVETLTSDLCVSLEAAELQVLEATRSWGQKVLEMCVSQKSGERVSEQVSCPAFQKACRPLRKRHRNFTPLCGVIRVGRWVYHCESGHCHVPWEANPKVKGRYTHRVAELMCRMASSFDFRAAAKELSGQGIEVSHTTLHQKVREWSKALNNVSAQVEAQTLGEKERWYVSCDGCHTNSPDGWHEVKIGCVYRDYPQYGSHMVPSVRESSIRYVARRGDAASFGAQWFELAQNSGVYKEQIASQEVVVIGDGAAWIWNLADEYFPNAVEIMDYRHARSHLYEIAKQAFGEHQSESIEKWVELTDSFLYDGNTTKGVARLRCLGTQNAAVSKIVEREVGYFQKHTACMPYKVFRENGYQIGSGVIESACNPVVGQKCKQALMKWTQPGINAVLAWRCLMKNDTWDQYWSQERQAA